MAVAGWFVIYVNDPVCTLSLEIAKCGARLVEDEGAQTFQYLCSASMCKSNISMALATRQRFFRIFDWDLKGQEVQTELTLSVVMKHAGGPFHSMLVVQASSRRFHKGALHDTSLAPSLSFFYPGFLSDGFTPHIPI